MLSRNYLGQFANAQSCTDLVFLVVVVIITGHLETTTEISAKSAHLHACDRNVFHASSSKSLLVSCQISCDAGIVLTSVCMPVSARVSLSLCACFGSPSPRSCLRSTTLAWVSPQEPAIYIPSFQLSPTKPCRPGWTPISPTARLTPDAILDGIGLPSFRRGNCGSPLPSQNVKHLRFGGPFTPMLTRNERPFS